MEFSSLGSLALHFATAAAAEVASLEHGLEVCAQRIEATAKAEIGHYQSGIGPFPAWNDLAEATEAEKARKGYPADAPLEASGAMRDSVTHVRHGLEAVIGSTDPKLVYHEFGTPHITPRPVMGPAVLRNKEFIRRTIGKAAVQGLIGGRVIHAALGYDSST
jgi:phage gpG-like protein